MKRQKQSLPKYMTAAELRKQLWQTQAQLAQCIAYNRQWETVAKGFERQKNELLVIVQQQQAELEHWRALARGVMQ